MIRVLIADDEPLVRAGIRSILASANDIEVVVEAEDARGAVEAARRHRVDLALLDMRMPGLNGLSPIAELARAAPATRVVILTTFGEDGDIARALRGGAAGFLLKDSAPDELIRALRAVADGQAHPARKATEQRLAPLSERELEVLVLLARGFSNADIGVRLLMSEATIKTYVCRILSKLGCTNRVEAAILAHDAGLASEE